MLSFQKIMIALAISSSTLNVAHAELTLCKDFEEVYFSCHASGKIISLCASGNISPNNGYVQYRIGTKEKIELQYPERSLPPHNRFSISDVSAANASSTHIKFRRGAYNYVVYASALGGVYVKRGDKLLSNRVCEPGIYQRFNSRAFRGIGTVAPIDGID
ncbi:MULTISPECIES: hypothetical protein [unclassified Caballeronia]|uniref:hypothetical protein n=1 Tax=unclassified Caballeronia TaxID=2646786 RepID=UPI00285CEB89|nr:MULTISPECIES: hypothetical protein [unclassified Caballeronia]MDR5774834.1 hypothetical protein [Caballeronia sp. LZ002]MDR5850270.1 hypothetical protein [Caballeronia sp. LZ003]